MNNKNNEIIEIKQEIELIKVNMKRIFRALSPVAGDRGSFDLLCYELSVTKEEEEWLLDLMDSIRKKLAKGEEYKYHMFERAIRERFGWSYQMAKSILLSLNAERRYSEIYEQFKKQGMNI